ncbi:MAG: gliding motility-associated C-terminal domain-containing protein [bacterium]|nr:gliding motility-associated C-terminal domain-containing protein [bacterium]
MNKPVIIPFLLLLFLLAGSRESIRADTNLVEVMASCTILSPVDLPDLNNDLVTIVDYDPNIIYTPETKIIVRMTTIPNLKARFLIDGIQNNKLFNFSEESNGIYYGGYKVQNEDVKRNTRFSVKLMDLFSDQEKYFTSDRLIQIDNTVYENEDADRIVISRDDPRTRVYLLKNSLFEDVKILIKRTNSFEKTIAYDFSMRSARSGKKLTAFRKKNRMDIHFQVFNKDKIEEIGMSMNESTRLMIYHYDGVQWMPVGGELDRERQVMSAEIDHFSIYALREKDDIEFKIGPNPFTPNADGINDEVKFYISNKNSEKVSLRIFKLNGSLVRELSVVNNIQTGMAESSWDGRDSDHDLCEDGIYIYQITVAKKHYNGVVVLAK